jgi:hypothetical protein
MYNWSDPGVGWIQEENNSNSLPYEMWYKLKDYDDIRSQLSPHITEHFFMFLMPNRLFSYNSR